LVVVLLILSLMWFDHFVMRFVSGRTGFLSLFPNDGRLFVRANRSIGENQPEVSENERKWSPPRFRLAKIIKKQQSQRKIRPNYRRP
jgi:hypothetical protein